MRLINLLMNEWHSFVLTLYDSCTFKEGGMIHSIHCFIKILFSECHLRRGKLLSITHENLTTFKLIIIIIFFEYYISLKQKKLMKYYLMLLCKIKQFRLYFATGV